jgi:hypothetical protein
LIAIGHQKDNDINNAYFRFLLRFAKIDETTHADVDLCNERCTVAEMKLGSLKGRISMVSSGEVIRDAFRKRFGRDFLPSSQELLDLVMSW